MQRLRTIGFIIASVLCFAPLATAQDFDRHVDESGQRGWQQYGAMPWGVNEQVAADAHRLSQQASRMAQALQQTAGAGYLTQQSNQLATAAEQFHRAVEASAPPRQVMQSFMNLQQQYYNTRTAFFQANRTADLRQLSDNWARLAASHERLALSMGVQEDQFCNPNAQASLGGYGQPGPGYQYGRIR